VHVDATSTPFNQVSLGSSQLYKLREFDNFMRSSGGIEPKLQSSSSQQHSSGASPLGWWLPHALLPAWLPVFHRYIAAECAFRHMVGTLLNDELPEYKHGRKTVQNNVVTFSLNTMPGKQGRLSYDAGTLTLEFHDVQRSFDLRSSMDESVPSRTANAASNTPSADDLAALQALFQQRAYQPPFSGEALRSFIRLLTLPLPALGQLMFMYRLLVRRLAIT